MMQTTKQQSGVEVTCPSCGAPLMTHSKRSRLERNPDYDIEHLKCERCGFETPNLIDKNSE